jgi:uncharacterized protein YegP (UPF0339 family)
MSGNHYEVYPADNGGFGWRLKAANQEIVATAGQTFGDKHGARKAVDRVRRLAADTPTVTILDKDSNGKETSQMLVEPETGETVEHQLRRTLERIRALLTIYAEGEESKALTLYSVEVEDVLRRFAADRISRNW